MLSTYFLSIFSSSETGIFEFPQIDPTTLVLITFACVLLLEILIYVILYRKPRIDEAIVRTGAGGVKVTVHNGIFIMPLFHKYKTVCMCQHTLLFDFSDEFKISWANNEEFHGKIFVTVQVPPENSTMIIAAARNLENSVDPKIIYQLIEPAFRASIREHFRTFREETFAFEPSTIEVRLSRSLDLVAFVFGLKIRAVHIHESGIDSDSKLNIPLK